MNNAFDGNVTGTCKLQTEAIFIWCCISSYFGYPPNDGIGLVLISETVHTTTHIRLFRFGCLPYYLALIIYFTFSFDIYIGHTFYWMQSNITHLLFLWCCFHFESCKRLNVWLDTIILSCAGHSQYVIVLTLKQCDSIITIHFCGTYAPLEPYDSAARRHIIQAWQAFIKENASLLLLKCGVIELKSICLLDIAKLQSDMKDF